MGKEGIFIPPLQFPREILPQSAAFALKRGRRAGFYAIAALPRAFTQKEAPAFARALPLFMAE
jgi:hypothetical protein